MDFSKLIDFIKLSPKYYLAIALFSGILLFLPEAYIEYLDLSDFVSQNKNWISLIFLFFLVLFAITAGTKLIKHVSNLIFYRKIIQNGKKRLLDLTYEEKKVLYGYIDDNSRTQYFYAFDGVVLGLEKEGIIIRAYTTGELHNFAFNIQPWAWDFLQKNSNKIFNKRA